MFFLERDIYLHYFFTRVREDICKSLIQREPFVFIGSFDRPNLFYGVKLIRSSNEAIAELIRDVPRRVSARESTIIYCITICDTEQAGLFFV